MYPYTAYIDDEGNPVDNDTNRALNIVYGIHNVLLGEDDFVIENGKLVIFDEKKREEWSWYQKNRVIID